MKAGFHIVLFLLGSILPLAILAQAPSFFVHPLEEPLKEAKITIIQQGNDGFLWLGSSKGLFRYDGAGYTPYPAEDSLTNNWVTAIFEDANNRLWVGFKDGAIFYSENRKALQPWDIEEGWPVVPIRGFQQDSSGVFWIATYGEGLYYYRQNHLYNFNTDDGLLGNDIYTMVKCQAGKIWVGTDGGVSICSVPGGQKEIRQLTRADGLPDEIVRALAPDDQGNLWIGTYDKGVCYFDTKKWEVQRLHPNWGRGIVNTLEIVDDRELWVGTEDQGLFRIDLNTNELKQITGQGQLAGSKVYDLHYDLEGNLWVLNNPDGIGSANLRFEQVRQPPNQIQAVLTDHSNQVWVGTPKGLFRFGASIFHPYLSELSLNVISLYEDPFHHIWIGTFGSGVYCLNPATGKFRRITEADGLTNNSVLSIDGQGDQVWLATLGGVTKIDIHRPDIMQDGALAFHNFNKESGLGANYIYTVFIDSQERVWFGTDGRGCSVLEEGKITNFTEADSLSLKTVYSITEDNRGHIWLSTAKEGLFEYDGQHFSRLETEKGVGQLEIGSLTTDKNGNLLIIHQEGIDLLNPANHHRIQYGEQIGISDLQPHLNTVATDKNGTIWIGAQKQLLKYVAPDPGLQVNCPSLLNSVSVFLEPVDFLKKTVYQHHENNLIFNYIGLWYTAPSDVTYRYKLEGYDFDWIHSRDRQTTYSNLSPGSYTFKVSASHNGIFNQEPVTTYSFRIKPPFWHQLWFLIPLLLFLGGLIYWIIRSRERRLRQQDLLKKEKAESQFEALKSQINPHFLFNSFNTLISIIEENPDHAVEYVEKLSDVYRGILQYRERETIPFGEEIELVKNYAFLLKKRYGKNLDLNIDAPNLKGEVAPLTLQMLVENAIKHNVISQSKPLRIDIHLETTGYVTVSNNIQKKLQPERSTGFGLQSIRTRYDLLSDRKVIIEESGETFIVSIPLLKNGIT